MKVGDLVRHDMYSPHMPAALVLKVRHPVGGLHQILILDKGDIYWDHMHNYEVISESR
jgi:hypothetical protein